MKILIISNGPPSSGKNHIINVLPYRNTVAFSDQLKRDTHIRYGYPERHIHHHESNKDIPHPDFNEQTPREAYMHTAEEVMKPRHGQEVYGAKAADMVDTWDHDEACVDMVVGAGFEVELNHFIERVEGYYDKVILLRLHHETDFSKGNDNRCYRYLHDKFPDIIGLDIFNDKTVNFDNTVNHIIQLAKQEVTQ